MKITIIGEILVQMLKTPGITRAQLRKALPWVKEHTLNMYLCSNYGYLDQPRSYRPKPALFAAADFKPAKGRIVYSFYLNSQGHARAERYLLGFLNS